MFRELESVSIDRWGTYAIFIRISGMIRFRCKQGTRYYQYSTPEFIDTETMKQSEANEILFDKEYNNLVEEHFDMLLTALINYQNKEEEENKAEKKVSAQTFIHTGNGDINYRSNNDFRINDSILDLSNRNQNETTGEERDEMLRILFEVELLIKEMKETGGISKKSKSKIEKIGDHLKKHE